MRACMNNHAIKRRDIQPKISSSLTSCSSAKSFTGATFFLCKAIPWPIRRKLRDIVLCYSSKHTIRERSHHLAVLFNRGCKPDELFNYRCSRCQDCVILRLSVWRDGVFYLGDCYRTKSATVKDNEVAKQWIAGCFTENAGDVDHAQLREECP